MKHPESFTALIKQWSSVGLLARDIGRKTNTVHKWSQNDSIPARDWSGVIESARRHSIPNVTAEVLVSLANRGASKGDNSVE